MSEVYVYGVAPASERADIAAAGVGPGPVRWVAHGDLAALVSDTGPEPLRAAESLRAHWAVLDEAVDRMTVLPVRYGTVMAGDQSVVDDLLAHEHDRIAATLAELAGRVQLTVKGTYEEESLLRGVVEGSPAVARARERVRGKPEAAAYYERIELGELVAGEVERARERDMAFVLERLEPLAVASRPEQPSTPETAVHAAFLVERRRMEEFARAVGRLGQELAGRVQLRCIGPLPAYSFADYETAAGSRAWA
jgi:hypothetical protein